MGELVFQPNVLTRIIHYLDRNAYCNYALTCKDAYKSTRLYGAKNMRWKIYDTPTLNRFMFNPFFQQF